LGNSLRPGRIGLVHRFVLGGRNDPASRRATKKADAGKHPKVLNHVGLLFNEPPGKAGLLFTKSSENLDRNRRNLYGGPAHYKVYYIQAPMVAGFPKITTLFARRLISCSPGYRDQKVSLLAE
jgi:hypothetical protein